MEPGVLSPRSRLVIGSAEVELHLSDLGATVDRLHFAGRDIAFLGETVGRYANRIANAQFTLDGVAYPLAANEAPNILHGGPDGFHRRVWEVARHTDSAVLFTLDSPDGDQGFPGRVQCAAAYTVDGPTVTITYTATASRPTVVSLANHAYFNLNGGGTIDDHELTLHAAHFTPVGPDLIPLGQIAPVAGTAMDWREPRPLLTAALDHNFVIDQVGMRTAAHLRSPASGIALTVHTDQPGLQVYTGDQLDRAVHGYDRRAGIALETQQYPDAPNRPAFPSPVLRPGQTYRSVTTWHCVVS